MANGERMKLIYILLCTTFIYSGYFTDNFLKYSTFYAGGSISSPLASVQTLNFTGTDIEEGVTETPFDYSLSMGIRKMARFKYQVKKGNFYDGSEKDLTDNATIGSVPGWEYLFKYTKLRNMGTEFIEQEYWIRYVGKSYIIKTQYSEYGEENLTYGQFDLKYRKNIGGLDITIGPSFRGRPIVIIPDIDWTSQFDFFYQLAYYMNYSDQWYYLDDTETSYDWYWYDPDGNLIASTDDEFYNNIFEGVVIDYRDSFIEDYGWQWEASLAIGLDYYHYGNGWWLHTWATVLPYHHGLDDFVKEQDRKADHDIGIIFGWKLGKHLGIFTEGRHLSYFNTDISKNEHYEIKAGLNYTIF